MTTRGSGGGVRVASAVLGAALALALAPSSFASAAPAADQQAPAKLGSTRYRAVDLGTLGGQSSYATAMNDRGVVVGRAQVADGTWHGFLWRRGSMIDLGLFAPTDINNRGHIVGTGDERGGAYRWVHGRLTPLGGGMTHPEAMNDHGQVVGDKSLGNGTDVPVLWTRGGVRVLPLDDVSGVNNRGQVSGGQRLTTGGFHASVWHRGRVTNLGVAAFDRGNSYGINDSGWVIGWTFSAQQDERGALWRHGTRTDLGTLGGKVTQTVAINDRGVVLAKSQVTDGNMHPALWRRGVLTDLTVGGVSADGEVVDLNDGGEIAASIRPEWGISRATVYRPRG